MTSLFGAMTASNHTHKALYISFWGSHKSLHKNFSPWCPLHFAWWNKSLMHLHHNSIWLQQCPLRCPSVCASYYAHIIKTCGKQLVSKTVKSTVEVLSVPYIISISTVWEMLAGTISCTLLHSTMASITATEWGTNTAVHMIILPWISENVMCEPTNREGLL